MKRLLPILSLTALLAPFAEAKKPEPAKMSCVQLVRDTVRLVVSIHPSDKATYPVYFRTDRMGGEWFYVGSVGRFSKVLEIKNAPENGDFKMEVD